MARAVVTRATGSDVLTREGITIVDLRGLAPIGVDRWPVAEELAAPVRDAALARIVPSLVAPDDVTVAYSDISLFSG